MKWTSSRGGIVVEGDLLLDIDEAGLTIEDDEAGLTIEDDEA